MTVTTNETIHIMIKSVEGEENWFDFKQTTLVGEAKSDAMKRFGIVPPLDVKYLLAVKKSGSYTPLDDSKTLEAEDVKNKEVLWLGTEQHVG